MSSHQLFSKFVGTSGESKDRKIHTSVKAASVERSLVSIPLSLKYSNAGEYGPALDYDPVKSANFVYHYLENNSFSTAQKWSGIKIGGLQVFDEIESEEGPKMYTYKFKTDVVVFRKKEVGKLTGDDIKNSSQSTNERLYKLLVAYRVANTNLQGRQTILESLKKTFRAKAGVDIVLTVGSCGALEGGKDLDKMMAVLDFVYNNMSMTEDAFLRTGTITTYHRDNAILGRLTLLSTNPRVIECLYYFSLDTQISQMIDDATIELGKQVEDSATCYMGALGLVEKSKYSSTNSSKTFIYLSYMAARTVNSKLFNTFSSCHEATNGELLMVHLVAKYAKLTSELKETVFLDSEQRPDKTDGENSDNLSQYKTWPFIRSMILFRLKKTLAFHTSEVQEMQASAKPFAQREGTIASHIMTLTGENTRFLSSWLSVMSDEKNYSTKEYVEESIKNLSAGKPLRETENPEVPSNLYNFLTDAIPSEVGEESDDNMTDEDQTNFFA